MRRTRPLDPIEVRVLGALMEKEQTTPDHYPLTINGVIAACNQKSNRDPVMSLTETQVVEALDRLRQEVLTWRSEGARVERWEHRLDRRWSLTSASKAVMTLLLLRGPQTPGELKTRSARLHAFGRPEEVEQTLRGLTKGFDPLVRELPRRPGQREARWTHVVGTEEPAAAVGAVAEPEAPASSAAPAPSSAAPSSATPSSAPSSPVPAVPEGPSPVERLETLEREVAELRDELWALRRRLGDLE